MSKPRYQRLVQKPSEAKKKVEEKIPENGLYIWLRSPRNELPNKDDVSVPKDVDVVAPTQPQQLQNPA